MPSDIERGRVYTQPDECEHQQRRFLERLVHDARACQREINVSAEILQTDGNQLTGDALQLLQRIQGGVAKMNSLLAGVNNYSMCLPAAGYSFALVSIEVPLQLAVASLAASIQDCSAVVKHGDLPQAKADTQRLTWLFQNLIDNALKYRDANAPRVEIEARRNQDDYVFSVKDNGCGIAQKYWGGLFEPFHRLHGSEIPGAGLGLATCKKIVQAHRGRIWIESESGKGSTFFFTLPAEG
jgi:chemotaxis family two-component system sensor kinase Cph1